jgi:hypothetical protein
MSYKNTSDREVCGKKPGESITEKELADYGANIDALIDAGTISTSSTSFKSVVNESGA